MANSIEEVVHVSIIAQDAAVAQESFDKLLFAAYHTVGPELVRDYTDVTALNTDFAAWPSVRTAAARFFAQNPHPTTLSIGRLTTARAKIFTATPTAANAQAYTVYVNGTAFTYTSDSSATAAEICDGLKTLIDAASITGLTTASATGVLTLTGAAGTWYSFGIDRVDLWAIVETTAASGLTTELNSILAERNDCYGVAVEHQSEAVAEAVYVWAEAPTKIYGVSCPNSDIIGSGTTDLGSDNKAAANNRTFVMFHERSSEQFPEVGWMASRFPANPGSENWRYKRIAGVTGSKLTGTQITNVKTKNVNTVRTMGGIVLTNNNKMGSGRYIDVQHGIDWLQARIEERLFSLLANNGKIPYTDAGLALIEGEVRAQLDEASDQDHNFLARDNDLTVTVTPVLQQASIDRAARIVRGIKFKGRLAGAVDEMFVNGVVFP